MLNQQPNNELEGYTSNELKQLLADAGHHIGIRNLYKKLDVLVENGLIEPAKILRINRMGVTAPVAGWRPTTIYKENHNGSNSSN